MRTLERKSPMGFQIYMLIGIKKLLSLANVTLICLLLAVACSTTSCVSNKKAVRSDPQSFGIYDGHKPLIWYVWQIERAGSDQGNAGLVANDQITSVLRKIGTNAVPRLVEELAQPGKSREAEYRRENAAFALGVIGPDAKTAIPSLVKALDDTGMWLRPVAIQALGKIHGDAKTVIPILIGMVNHSTRYTNFRGYASHQMAVIALGEYGAEAKPAIPSLLATLKDPNELFRKQALEALKKIDPAVAVKVDSSSESH